MADFSGLPNASVGTQLIGQFVSAPLAVQTITGSIKGQFRCFSDSAGNFRLAVAVRKCALDGSGVVSLLAPTHTSDVGTPPQFNGVSLQNRRLEEGSNDFAVNLASTGLNAQDRLIIEIGYKDDDAGSADQGNINFGDNSGTDLAEDESTTTANNPWVELTHDLLFYSDAHSPITSCFPVPPPGYEF
jgi:hypothetical protein